MKQPQIFYNINFNINIVISFIILSALFTGCIVVKHPARNDVAPNISLSPKPVIEMSDQIVRSKIGDMISFIPKDWFFVDLKSEASSEIIALAVNPEYSLSAVFSKIRKTKRLEQVVEKEGLLGLARISFSHHERKTAGSVKLIGKYQIIKMGPNEFVKYEFTSSGGALSSTAAVFISDLNVYYEFALMPMNILFNPVPDKEEFRKIFQSILATIKCR